jgi:hypothetical protein
MRKLLVLAAAALAGGCVYNAPPPEEPASTGQSYLDALQSICDVDRLASISPDDDPLSAGAKRNAWIQQHVENPDAIYLRTMLSVKGAGEQATALREEAKGVGLARCALADEIEKSGAGGLSP